MLFINTRPQNRAMGLTTALTDCGVDVFDLPLLELVASPWSIELQRLYQQLPHVKVIVVVSPTAVELGMQYAKKMGYNSSNLQHIEWISVGNKTAQTLKAYGFTSHVPDVETSEGMLNLPILKSLQAQQKVAFWRGLGGRQFMMDTLTQRDMQVLNFVLYERKCPDTASQRIPRLSLKLQQHSKVILLITSEASWLNWVSLIQHQHFNLKEFSFWVLGDRLFELLLNYRQIHHLEYKLVKVQSLKTDCLVSQISLEQGNT